ISGHEHLPIVALTAGALRDEKEACLEAGMNAFLSKPFRPRDLTETLRRVSNN
ncbi:response regulator, partial [bacterium]